MREKARKKEKKRQALPPSFQELKVGVGVGLGVGKERRKKKENTNLRGQTERACYLIMQDHLHLRIRLHYVMEEWSKDRTQAAESIKWRPQQAYGSNQVLLSQPQTIFSTPKIITLTHR